MTSDRWQKIEEVYHAALDLRGELRAAYLNEVCAGDSDLRHEVESLLAQAKSGDSFLEVPAYQAARQMSNQDPSPSMIGRQIGSYLVVSLLGRGGMGEVYEAYDSKLERNVAIKFLPAHFVHDPERLCRFQREARVLASLNHPNIATIYGLEQSDGVHYLVMELVPGPTLAERSSEGGWPLPDALKVACQITEALEAAHERGVIHRDLKPANVKVTPEGRVKVLDFGLAKAFAGDCGADLAQISTLSQEGTILGTPAYMSPEQARGKPVDKRTDIWAFGCVLCELLTGHAAFHGETIQDTIVAVLEREPDQQALPASTPTGIRELLRRCLLKDRLQRLRDIGEARIELQQAISKMSSPETTDLQKRVRPKSLAWRWAASLVGFAIIFVAFVTWYLKLSAPASGIVSRLAIQLPAGQQIAGVEAGEAIAISPDGTRLAYIAREGGVQQLYIRPLESLDAKAVPGSEGAVEPFFSPDGAWLGFFAGGKLKKVSISGSETMSLTDAGDPRGASWSSRGILVLAPTRATILQQVADSGGVLQPLTHIEKNEGSHRWPEFLPDGRAVLFAAGNSGVNWDGARIAVQSMETSERRNLIENATQPHYASSGHLVYARSGNLMAVPFNVRRLEVEGTPVPVVEGVLQLPLTGAAQYSLSTNGSLVYVPAVAQAAERRLVWVSRTGVEEPLQAPSRAYRQPRLSPDGRLIAVAIEEQETEIWLYNLARETLTRFTLEGSLNNNPVWTPDGKRVLFQSEQRAGSEHHLFWQNADGSGGPEKVTTTSNDPNSFFPDGRLLALSAPRTATGWDITVVRISDDTLQPFLTTPFNEGSPTFSPDGRWLAYSSDSSGRYEIYVQPYPEPGEKWQISTEGGTEPVWNRNGRELFYRNGDKMMAVDIAAQRNFSVGRPRLLFVGHYQAGPTLNANYDVSPDGHRFLMLKPADTQQAATQINVVLNWFDELKRRVPVGIK